MQEPAKMGPVIYASKPSWAEKKPRLESATTMDATIPDYEKDNR